MVTLFRRLRKKLINEGNLKRYTTYAIGEILLVVIGILIALQINNLNESSKLRKKEKKMLIELRRNLDSNITLIKGSISRDIKTRQSAQIIIDHLINKKPYHDSLNSHFTSAPYHKKINLTTSAYSSMESFGFDIIHNDTIRERMISLYEVKYPELIQETYELQSLQYRELITPIYSKNFSINENDIAVPNNYADLIQNQEFINIITMVSSFRNWGVRIKERAIIRTEELIQQIDRELKLVK